MPRGLLAVALACLALAPSAQAKVYLGVLGSPERFAAQTGQHTATRLIIAG